MNDQTHMLNADADAVAVQDVVAPQYDAIAGINQHEAQEVQKNERKPIKVFGVTISGPLEDGIHAVQDFGTRWRKGAIEKTPAVIVNHSSNVIGSMQLIAEVLMTKSSGINLVDAENRSKPLHYIIDPVKNIYGGALKKSRFSLGGNPLELSFYKELPSQVKTSFEHLRDLDKATTRDRVNTAPMFNKWQARSGLAGILAMTVATFLPDKKDTPEETERMTKLSKEHPVRYVATRVYQALNPLEWWNHKRQFAGLGMMTAGGLSVVSGYRQVEGKFTADMIKAGLENKQNYMHNGWQVAGGFITVVGGTQLMLAIDNEQGWRNFGVTQMTRLLTLPNSIMTRFKKTEQGAAWYLAGNSVFQVKNLIAASIGGAEVDKDGHVIDHSIIRQEAAEKTKIEIAQNKANGTNFLFEEADKLKDVSVSLAPATNVTSATEVSRAMPERFEENQKQIAEAATKS